MSDTGSIAVLEKDTQSTETHMACGSSDEDEILTHLIESEMVV